MAQNPDESWFFSQGGQQQGPVPFSELQAKVNGGELDPAKDLVWKNGMASWTPVGQMLDTFKVAGEPEPEPAPAPAAQKLPKILDEIPDELGGQQEPKPEPKPEPAPEPEPKPEPKPAPKQGIQQPAPKQNIQQPAPKPDKSKVVDAEADGANRLHYFLGVYIFPIVWMFILTFVMAALGGQGSLAGIIALIGMLVPLIVVIVVVLKRFTNLAMSRWWILGYLVPLLNLWVGYRLFACPSGYGAGRKMDGIGIFLAILYWLSLIAMVAAIPVMMVFAITTALENPEIMNDPQAREELNRALIELRDMIKGM